ncbi:MAG: hypothetical protein ACLPYS_08500 [Vulcanimicrobiaceae bacterium]
MKASFIGGAHSLRRKSYSSKGRGSITLAPDIAFQHCANAAAAIIQRAPAFVTYQVATRVDAPSLGKQRDIIREVSVRTSDDLSVVQDLPQGRNQLLAHSFPVTPAFDALSYFTLSWRVGAHEDVSAYVHDVTPLHYADVPLAGADVVVVRLRAYRATYAPDSSDAPDARTHILLEPFDFVKRQVVRPDSTFFLSDLYIDNASGMPSEVKYSGGDDLQFVVDYASVGGYWLVDHAHYEETVFFPLHVARYHIVADALYSDFTFPVLAPDPRLALRYGAPPGAAPPAIVPGATGSP